jgi:Glycosyltransferase family 87
VRLVSAAIGCALFLGSWGLLHYGFYTREQIVDTPVYQRYGEAMTRGEVPYRDFAVEYPPAALPVFLLPALGEGDLDDFERGFEGLMAAFGVACVLLVAMVASSWWAPLVVGVAPLALGSVILSRFDLWPAALTVAALALLSSGRFRLGLATLGVATAAKLYPALLVPIALAHVWRLCGRREALICSGMFAGVVVAIVGPFAVLAPDGVWDSLYGQAGRPLQIESLGAGLLLGAHHLLGVDVTMESSHGSQNLDGAAADVLGGASTLLQAASVVAIWAWYARGPATRDRLLAAGAAVVCAFIAFGKVFSPQFLIWLIPLVPLVGLVPSLLFAAALVLTQLWFPYRYWDLALEFDQVTSWLVLTRDLVVVALTLVLIARARPGRARSP